MVNRHRKGQEAERAVLRMLRDKFGGHWERRPLGIPGPDIFSPSWFPFATEVKDHATVKMSHLFGRDKPTAMLKEFWMQTVEQAKLVEKRPLLVVKVERQWFVTENFQSWMKFKVWLDNLEEK